MAVKEKSGIIRGLNKGHVSPHYIRYIERPGRVHSVANGRKVKLKGFVLCGNMKVLIVVMAKQKVTPREFKPRISRTKGHLSKRTQFVREIVKEVSGYVLLFFAENGGIAPQRSGNGNVEA